jgi:hypothetical protein
MKYEMPHLALIAGRIIPEKVMNIIDEKRNYDIEASSLNKNLIQIQLLVLLITQQKSI